MYPQLIQISFDGGCIGNPGAKYGSWMVTLHGNVIISQNRFQFGHGTNNEAEFNALQMALDETYAWLENRGVKLSDYQLSIFTDSKIVRNRLVGRNKIFHKYPSSKRMFTLASECLKVMHEFSAFEVKWHGRERNVELFGH